MRPGTTVLCVDDSIRPEAMIAVVNHFPNWVTKGKRYVVREFLDNDGIVPGLLLEEVRNPDIFIPLIGRWQEPAFALWRFRELTPLDPVEEEVEAASPVEA
jgi:hypothetical protein